MFKSSAIICTKDRIQDIHLILDSLLAVDFLPDELIVVDSSHGQDLDKYIRKKYQDLIGSLEYKYFHDSPGLTHQRNTGIKHSSGDIIHFLEDDIVLAKDYFDKINEIFEINHDIGGITGVIKNFTSTNTIFQLFNRIFLLPTSWNFEKSKLLRSHFAVTNNEIINNNNVNRLRGVSSYRRAVFNEELFDESLSGYGAMEDIDFSFRVSKKWPLVQSPDVVFWHYPSISNRLSTNAYYRNLRDNQKYLFKKNINTNYFYLRWSQVGLFILYKIILPTSSMVKKCIK